MAGSAFAEGVKLNLIDHQIDLRILNNEYTVILMLRTWAVWNRHFRVGVSLLMLQICSVTFYGLFFGRLLHSSSSTSKITAGALPHYVYSLE